MRGLNLKVGELVKFRWFVFSTSFAQYTGIVTKTFYNPVPSYRVTELDDNCHLAVKVIQCIANESNFAHTLLPGQQLGVRERDNNVERIEASDLPKILAQ